MVLGESGLKDTVEAPVIKRGIRSVRGNATVRLQILAVDIATEVTVGQ